MGLRIVIAIRKVATHEIDARLLKKVARKRARHPVRVNRRFEFCLAELEANIGLHYRQFLMQAEGTVGRSIKPMLIQCVSLRYT